MAKMCSMKARCRRGTRESGALPVTARSNESISREPFTISVSPVTRRGEGKGKRQDLDFAENAISGNRNHPLKKRTERTGHGGMK